MLFGASFTESISVNTPGSEPRGGRLHPPCFRGATVYVWAFSRPVFAPQLCPECKHTRSWFPIEHPHSLWEAYKQNPGARMFEPLGKYRVFFWIIKKVNRKFIKLDYTLATLFTLHRPWPFFWKRLLLERWMHFEFSPIPTAFPFPPDKVAGVLASRVVIVDLGRARKNTVCLFFEPNCFRGVYSQCIWLFIIHHYPLNKHFESLRCICSNFTRFCCSCKWVWRWILIWSWRPSRERKQKNKK